MNKKRKVNKVRFFKDAPHETHGFNEFLDPEKSQILNEVRPGNSGKAR